MYLNLFSITDNVILKVSFKSREHIQKKEYVPYLEVSISVELQWLENLWDYKNLFKTGVVRAIEGSL